MKNTGIIRHVDELGRITLPIEIRRSLGLSVKDPVQIYVDGDHIILKRALIGDISEVFLFYSSFPESSA